MSAMMDSGSQWLTRIGLPQSSESGTHMATDKTFSRQQKEKGMQTGLPNRKATHEATPRPESVRRMGFAYGRCSGCETVVYEYRSADGLHRWRHKGVNRGPRPALGGQR